MTGPAGLIDDSPEPGTAAALAERVRSDIVLGHFRAGEWLRQIDLQDRYAASRFALRQVLAELAQAGLVEHVPNRGFRVRESSRRTREEITAVRLMLELPACGLLVATATARDMAGLRAAAEAFDTALELAPYQELLRLNHRFHRRMFEPVANDTLVRLIHELRERDLPGTWSSWSSSARIRRSSRDHFEMVAALEARDAGRLCRATERHLTRWQQEPPGWSAAPEA